MKQELDIYFVERYPLLFKNREASPRESLMCFGCECGDGWFTVLDHLFGYLTSLMESKIEVGYTDEYKSQFDKKDKEFYSKHYSYRITAPKIILDQVKEKYGTLRVYYHTELEAINEEILKDLDKEDLDKKISEYYSSIDIAIDYAEYQSSVTCEITGKPGMLYTKGWYQVLCAEEALKKGYDPLAEAAKLIRTYC